MNTHILPLIANFGGPRHLTEISSFLQALLTDEEVIRTGWPRPIHQWFFSRVAKKRAVSIAKDYELIGGKSPIFEDTEAIASNLSKTLQSPVLTFHRYLVSTHANFLEAVQKESCEEIRCFPLFPQFSFATTGSIARWFLDNIPKDIVAKVRWVPSYCRNPLYIQSMQMCIEEFLSSLGLPQEETILLFSAHGLPKKFIAEGDIYERECIDSFEKIAAGFPKTLCRLSYQSKFGRGEWLRPYTNEICEKVLTWNEGRSHFVFIPLSFTTDHIETLFEIEYQYLPIIRNKGLKAYRCPALNHRPFWMNAIKDIFLNSSLASNSELIRKK